jgi:plasmid stability protein
MSSITIRNLDPAVKERLRIRAAQHGRSMEAEARNILQSALEEPARLPARNLMSASAPASSPLVAPTISSCRRVCRIAIRPGSIAWVSDYV